MWTFLALFCLLHLVLSSQKVPPSHPNDVDSDLDYKLFIDYKLQFDRWADLAYDFVGNLSCNDAILTTEEDCLQLIAIPKSEMNYYLAEPVPAQKYHAVLPDGPLTRTDPHDAVLVLDPYPKANLGHLLLVFFIDLSWTEFQCLRNGGQYTEGGVCFTVALRQRCHNLLQHSKWDDTNNRIKACEIMFFPLVYPVGEKQLQQSQKLKCRDDTPGFAACPVLRPKNKTDNVLCDAVEKNSYRCSNTAKSVGLRCRIFERCDHAVMISGGWDRLTDRPMYLENLHRFHEMLTLNGFPQKNIKIFYSNGKYGIDENMVIRENIFPSSLKLTMRYHIHQLCSRLHCADSFVIYLNSPTQSNGAALLWDIDRNGVADENEVYTIKELLADTEECAAQQVYIIADQNYSGKLIHALQHSNKHDNVIAFASGQMHEYSWNGDYTNLWTSYDHKEECVQNTHEMLKTFMNTSYPLSFDGSLGTLNTTIFGAPCDVRPPFTEYELQKRYFGCQNLPTYIWMKRTRAESRLDMQNLRLAPWRDSR
ncbi:uncharacterized protein [Parasteatoda tepidariorum]|uniref:uncharacterized protein n=1 Tax=Parasteatoda tepidariorum TaxID=114398 RepID=UPI00077FD2DB|nr:uncharacterized protein LOC107442497 [Parasteatoda tepidariorum]